MTSPTQRTLKLFRDKGYICEVVEHWNAFTKRRHDLLGFIDVLAIGDCIIGIQCTSMGHISDRAKKVLASPLCKSWLFAGGKICVIGWDKKKNRWVSRSVDITLDGVSPIVANAEAHASATEGRR